MDYYQHQQQTKRICRYIAGLLREEHLLGTKLFTRAMTQGNNGPRISFPPEIIEKIIEYCRDSQVSSYTFEVSTGSHYCELTLGYSSKIQDCHGFDLVPRDLRDFIQRTIQYAINGNTHLIFAHEAIERIPFNLIWKLWIDTGNDRFLNYNQKFTLRLLYVFSDIYYNQKNRDCLLYHIWIYAMLNGNIILTRVLGSINEPKKRYMNIIDKTSFLLHAILTELHPAKPRLMLSKYPEFTDIMNSFKSAGDKAGRLIHPSSLDYRSEESYIGIALLLQWFIGIDIGIKIKDPHEIKSVYHHYYYYDAREDSLTPRRDLWNWIMQKI